MCGPAAIPIMMIASTAISGYSAFTQAKTQKAVAENNATIAGMQAQDALARGEKAGQDSRHHGSMIEGAQRASMAARGLDLTEGTPNSILGQTDFFTQSDAATARTNSRKEAWARTAQQGNFQAEAGSINPGLTLAGTLLGGASRVSDRWYANQKPGG